MEKICFSVLLLLVLVINTSLGFPLRSEVACRETEKQALLAFKQGIVDKQNQLSSWGGAEPQNPDCCTWKGVYCDNNTGHVIHLDLYNQSLYGKLSPKITELQHLKYLGLGRNNFSGSQLPELISSLSNLIHLDASYCYLVGQIPFQFGNLTRLEYLDLQGNYFTRVENLNWLPHLSLKYFFLSETNLSNAFSWLETVNKIPNIRDLTISNCSLPPPVFPTLSDFNSSRYLVSVDLSENSAVASSIVLKWLCYNTRLVSLDLSHIPLIGSIPLIPLIGSIPDCFGNMSSLAHLDLDNNRLEAGIPQSFAKLCNLRSLSIGYNNLTGQFSEFLQILSNCSQNSLQSLFLSSNNIVGSLPDLTNFVSLVHLYVSSNRLSGEIPKSIGQMSKLESLLLGSNSFHGIISETHFSELSKLRALDLSKNAVVLDFHSDWVPPFQLRDILLGSCKMGPHFPKWLRTQKNYDWLDISDAGISDILPNWFWHLSNEVFYIDLSRNQIIGSFPDFILDFVYSLRLNLSQNQFEGAISSSILSQAVLVDLSYNNFTSLTPFSCTGTIRGLRYLDLSRNKISEEISGCWRDLENLVFLDLSENYFSGKIPTTMGYLSSLQTLKLNDNRFVGELPSSLKNCINIIHFNVGRNKLSGLVPEWLGASLPNLVILILRSNNFYGRIPPQICHLTKIHILDLSMNNISGSIPYCIDNLTALKQNLSGTSNLTVSHIVYGEPQGRVLFWMVKYEEEESIMWKGIESKYKSTLGLVKSIDLSSNRLSGEIPREINLLVGLRSLNLSRNHLTGQITSEMGMLRSLQSLDLSRNGLYGSIPRSLFQIYGLGSFNLSYNNLSGEIPIGSQLQNYESSSFVGNPLLCGISIAKMCDSEKQNRQGTLASNEEDRFITKDFYISMALGFIFAFWGVCGSLMIRAFKRDPRLSGTSRHRCIRQFA